MAHIILDGIEAPVSNIFCIGRNYAEHARELGETITKEPLVFLKPTSALLREGSPIILPIFSEDVHYECELLIFIKQNGNNIPEAQALEYVCGYGIGLDLTARDVQAALKEKGQPWAKAKGFKGSACVSDFVTKNVVADPQCLGFSLSVNGKIKQTGCSTKMIFSMAKLISYLSSIYGLQQGDIIFTGTPAGVGPIRAGDHLELDLHGHIRASFDVVA